MTQTFDEIIKDLSAFKPAPVYLLHGEESFFIDRLVEKFEQLLPEQERTFNAFNIYALEKEPEDIMELARRYPLMSDRIVIVVKETQAARGGAGKWINRLAKYAVNPNPSTVLIIVSRGAKVSCKEFTDALKKSGGVVFESVKLRDDKIPGAIISFLKEVNLLYEPEAVAIIADNIGNDLAKIYNEISKLRLILPPGATVTPEVVEKNIGINRNFNNFELTKAISKRDIPKSLQIIRHFNSNPKDNPWVVTLSVLFNLFSNTLIAYYTNRSDASIMQALNLRNQYAINDYKNTMKNYSASQVIEIIELIRRADSNGKGNGSRMPVEIIMENLILQIFMASGNFKKN